MSGAPEWVSLVPAAFGWALSLPEERDGSDVKYVRADIFEAAIAAARAEGERVGMERAAARLDAIAAGTPFGHENLQRGWPSYNWLKAQAAAIRAAMDAKPPQPEYPGDADIDRSLSTAGLLPDFLKPVDRP